MTAETVLWALSVPAVLFLVYLASLRVSGQMVRDIDEGSHARMVRTMSRRFERG